MSTNLEDIQSGMVPNVPFGQPQFTPQLGQVDPAQYQAAADLNSPYLRAQNRQERMARYQNLISNFTYSLGSGLQASAMAGPGARNRTMAGMGAALVAPFALQRAQEQYALQKLQEERMAAQTQAALAGITNQNQRTANETAITGAKVPQIQAQTAGTVANTGLTQAKTTTEQARPDQIRAETAKANFITTPNGLYDISKGTIVTGTSKPDDRIEVTPDIAKALKLPDTFVGEHFRLSDINQLSKTLAPNEKIITLEDGVYKFNMDTGEKTRIGDRPKSSAQNMGGIARVMNPTTGEFAGWAFPDGRFVPAPAETQGLSTTRTPQATLTRNELLGDIKSKLEVLEADAKQHPAVIGGAFGASGKLGRLATSAGVIDDPEIADIYSLAQDLSDQRLRQRSGAQINPDEMQRITRFSPDPTSQTSTQFFNNIKNMRDEIDRMMKSQGIAPKPAANNNRPTPPAVTPARNGNAIQLQTDPTTGMPIFPR